MCIRKKCRECLLIGYEIKVKGANGMEIWFRRETLRGGLCWVAMMERLNVQIGSAIKYAE